MYPVYLKNVLIRHVAEQRGRESGGVRERERGREGGGIQAGWGSEGKYLEEAVFDRKENFVKFVPRIEYRAIGIVWPRSKPWKPQRAAEYFGTVDSSLSIIRI